jgi:hypothetical protein
MYFDHGSARAFADLSAQLGHHTARVAQQMLEEGELLRGETHNGGHQYACSRTRFSGGVTALNHALGLRLTAEPRSSGDAPDLRRVVGGHALW